MRIAVRVQVQYMYIVHFTSKIMEPQMVMEHFHQRRVSQSKQKLVYISSE